MKTALLSSDWVASSQRPSWLTKGKLSSIIADVRGSNGNRTPKDLDALCDDLNSAFAEFWVRSSLRSGASVEKQAALAEGIQRSAGTLARLLSSDQFVVRRFIVADWPSPSPFCNGLDLKDGGKRLSEIPPSLEAVIAALQRIEVLGREARSISNKWTRRGMRSDRSPFERLAGIALPKVYEQHFGERPRLSRPSVDPRPGGHFIRFAKAALDASNINRRGQPYSEESIAKALGLRQRPRRKPR